MTFLTSTTKNKAAIRAYTKLVLLIALVTSSSLGKAFFVEISGFGLTTQSAHEELTRQSLLEFDKHYKNQDAVSFLSLDGSDPMPNAGRAVSAFAFEKVTLGAYAPDFPKGRFPISLFEYWQLPRDIDPHKDHRVSVYHATRNYTDETRTSLVSSYETCHQVRKNIAQATYDILQFLNDRAYDKAYFLTGYALHTLQDSFSEAHIERMKSENFDPIDICYYSGHNEPGSHPSCFHSKIDHRDNIWLIDDSKLIELTQKIWGPFDQQVQALPGIQTQKQIAKFDINEIDENSRPHYLTHEARLAKVASARFLLTLASLTNEIFKDKKMLTKDKISKSLSDTLFEGQHPLESGKSIMPRGVLRCDRLKDRSH